MAKRIKESSWNGIPLFECPYCPHATTDGKGAVELHMTSVHADQIRLDQLIADAKEEAAEEAPAEGTGEPTGDLAATSAGHDPEAATTPSKKKE